MSIIVSAAVARCEREGFTIESLELEQPRADEVLIRFTAAGLCATDLHAAAGALPTPRPAVVGHEGVGVIELVGTAVTGLSPGDRVVCSFDSCGHCRNCQKGQPAYCDSHIALNFDARRADGTVGLRDEHGAPVHDHFFGQSSFANYGLAHSRSLVSVSHDLPPEVLAPLGCGIVTGAGAVWNALAMPPGSTLAVFGTGTVGLAAIMAARVAGAARVIAVDVHTERLDLAVTLGATDTIDASSIQDPAAAIAELTHGDGVDFSVESTGDVDVMSTAIKVLGTLGMAAVLGVAGLDADLRANSFELLKGRSVIGSVMGHQAPAVLIPRILDLYREGRFPIDRIVKPFPINEIDAAVAASRAGAIVKPVLFHEDPAGYA